MSLINGGDSDATGLADKLKLKLEAEEVEDLIADSIGAGTGSAVNISNWNSALGNGITYIGVASNAPTSGWYIGTYKNMKAGYGTQTVTHIDIDTEPETHQRSLKAYHWSAWVKLTTSTELAIVEAACEKRIAAIEARLASLGV